MYIKTSDQDILELGIGSYSCNRGIHICGWCENEEEGKGIIIGFLGQGLKVGDLEVYRPVKRSVEYSLINKFRGETPVNGVRTFPYSISAGAVAQNRYLIHPGQCSAENAQEYFTKFN